MKRTMLYLSLVITTSAVHGKEIQKFIQQDPPQSKRFQCAYQTRAAAKPCIVSLHLVKAEHPLTQKHFGNTTHPLLKIQWPDGNTSRFALMDQHQLLNIRNERFYQFKKAKQSSTDLDYTDGLVILDDQNEHVRLW